MNNNTQQKHSENSKDNPTALTSEPKDIKHKYCYCIFQFSPYKSELNVTLYYSLVQI